MPGLELHPLGPSDRSEWERLARGYKDFYEDPVPDAVYDEVWSRLMADGPVHGVGCRSEGALVGIAHFLFHAHSWKSEVCYLQDLFTLPDARGRGVARALIDAVADEARKRGCAAYYWLTKADNEPARALYDKIARNKGFIRYDYPL
ncbi:GNAT family N-acetyltransferase [Sphingosinicella sp.]|uniref:GNAT family N-acetyltransferase n=1 Tax=Sphingosinicella sp. TaxID=1917971 RepID=UPI004038414B